MEKLVNFLAAGGQLTRADALKLTEHPTAELSRAADTLRRRTCGDAFHLCTIINGKSGRCSENCAYCAQAACHAAQVEEYPMLPAEKMLQSAASNRQAGVERFSIVTSGRRLSDAELEQVCGTYRRIRAQVDIGLCASHGLLSAEQFRKLKQAGVTRYHNNLESSRAFFPRICTTHSYDDKLAAIRAAQEAGLEVCSGGIIGLGESMADRIDMALQLRELHVVSVPLNILNPIPGTPLANQPPLPEEEIIKTAALFRLILPKAELRLAGGRILLPDKGRQVFRSGVNAAISGDMLTTSGIRTAEDIRMVQELEYCTAQA